MKKIIHKVLREKTDNFGVQFFRYLLVGSTSFVFDFAILYLLTSIVHIPYLISTTLAFIVGLTVNYFLSIIWVFNTKDGVNRKREFTLFCIVGVIGLILTDLFMWLFTDKVHFFYLVSKIVTTVIIFFWNFLGRRYVYYFIDKKEEKTVKSL